MALSNWPWRRNFNRTPDPDLDDVPDQPFITANFTDFFGKWLHEPTNSQKKSFDSVLRPFWGTHIISPEIQRGLTKLDGSQQTPALYSFDIHCVADGGRWKSTQENVGWLNQHIRFAAFVAGGPNGAEQPFADLHDDSWTLCMVGSQQLTDEERFLQVASWDGSVFRYYARDELQLGSEATSHFAWIYQGVSTAAFGDQSYLGPFNGHVNGSLVMKELRQPWLHWKTDDFDPTSNFPQPVLDSFSKDKAPYLTDTFPLSRVSSAENMMNFVTNGITKWYRTRATMDFLDSDGNPKTAITSGLKRWMAHALLTTTVNVGVALPDQDRGDHHLLPMNHVYNSELASQYNKTHIWPSISQSSFTFSDSNYVAAAMNDVQLVMIQNVDTVPAGFTPIQLDPDTSLGPDGKNGLEPITAIQVEAGEGSGGVFTTIQPSYEDAMGVKTLMMQTSKGPLLSDTTYNAITMVDPWNPVYSWRRGVLLQYVPDDATLNADGKGYDMDDRFIANVQASPRIKDGTSPEAEFLSNLDQGKQTAFPHAMTAFFQTVQKRLKVQAGLADYLKLAESRRRIYRPLPLDEFALTLPWALKYDKGKYFEMKQNGTIQEMEARGVNFFNSWRISVSSYDPKVLPEPDANASDDVALVFENNTGDSALPQSTTVSCQKSAVASRLRKSGCPMRSRFQKKSSTQQEAESSSGPSWDSDVEAMFAEPYWLPEAKREEVGSGWRMAMLKYGAAMPDGKNLTLNNYEHVKLQAVTIYQHCASRSMPITSDPTEYWPNDALETFRTWINQGCRQSRGQPIVSRKSPVEPLQAPVFRTRKDIRDLTPAELQLYRTKLQDVLGLGALPSKWQDLGELHAWWCLHYQEATFPWHRCWLRHLEELIDFPIPYWNGFATDAAEPDSPFAGIPEIFLEEDYIHPDGSTRKNPLKYAYGYRGKSKDGTSKYVQRNPTLVKGRPSQPGPELDEWDREVHMFTKYHDQIKRAMQTNVFSSPQGLGLPWAAIPSFAEDMPDNWYSGQHSFDGWFEQAHDNFHGWIGGPTGDMADNTYTAFDPVFISYHCNMDRLFEQYIRSKPNLQTTSSFPLKPFVKGAVALDYTNPNSWMYASVGEMTMPVQSLGYIYAPPACSDTFSLMSNTLAAKPSGGIAVKLWDLRNRAPAQQAPAQKAVPYIIFEDVVCTDYSYEIDTFFKDAASTQPDPVANPHFIGRLFRLGMGKPTEGTELRNKGRCHKPAVTRVIDARHVEDKITNGFQQIVRRLTGDSTEEVPESEWRTMKGFVGELKWVIESVF